MVAFFQAVGEFLLIFTSSLILGSTLGIATALVNIILRYSHTRILLISNGLFLTAYEIHSNSGLSLAGNLPICFDVIHNFPHCRSDRFNW